MATARLRRTFQYPAEDSDEDDTPKDLDEEEQEKLIKKLKEEDDARIEQYRLIFLAVPILAAISYIPALLLFPLLEAKLMSLLCITSLAATAYILLLSPTTKCHEGNRSSARLQLERRQGPVNQYLSYLNCALSLLLSLNAYTFKDRRGVHEGFWLLCLLPIVVFSIILFARRVMLSVDVGELEGLKYGYRGA